MENQQDVYCIRVEDFLLDAVWDRCKEFLNNPDIGDIEYSSIDEAKENCKNGTYQLWILMKSDEVVGCFLTNIGIVSDSTSIVNVFNLSGHDIKSWVSEMDRKMVEFCTENGCKFYSYIGRSGFSKLVPELKSPGVYYLREVKNV